jgi:hypothetical protein
MLCISKLPTTPSLTRMGSPLKVIKIASDVTALKLQAAEAQWEGDGD